MCTTEDCNNDDTPGRNIEAAYFSHWGNGSSRRRRYTCVRTVGSTITTAPRNRKDWFIWFRLFWLMPFALTHNLLVRGSNPCEGHQWIANSMFRNPYSRSLNVGEPPAS